jgi:nitric oxide reductase subunit B
MLNIAMMTYAMPLLLKREPYNQTLNMWGFWVTSSAVAFMTFALTFAGVVQTHLQRVLGMNFMEVQEQLGLFYWFRLGAGFVTLLGVVMIVVSLVVPGKARAAARTGYQPAE